MDIKVVIKEKVDISFIGKLALIFTVIYLLAMFSIFRANFNYIDDLGRTLNGYRGWENFSRYVSNYLSVFIHAGRRLTDISPLPQIIAVFLMALSSSILVYVFSKERKLSVWDIFACVPMTLSPYFLECLSYKFDAPYMALSVLASVCPFLFWNFGEKFYIIVSIISIWIMCMTYQAASGIYPLVAIFLFLISWNTKSNDYKFIIYSVFAYITALTTFKLIFMKTVNTYVSNDIGEINNVFDVVNKNIIKYISLLKNDATNLWIALVLLIVISFVVSFVVSSKRNKISAFLLGLISVTLGCILSYGAYIILPKPLFAPRGMYGFGIFVGLIGILSVELWRKNILAKLTCMLLAWSLFVFSFSYGNALAEQKRYTDFRVQVLLNDISRLNIGKDYKLNMMLYGNGGKSPVVKNMEKNYRILSRLVPSTVGSNWWWNEYYLYNYFSLTNIKQVFDKNKKYDNFDRVEIPTVVDTCYHTIKSNDREILVKFK